MNTTVVIYYSKYGSTRQYAQWLGEELECDVVSVEDLAQLDFSTYNRVIFGSPLQFDQFAGLRELKLITALHPELDIVAFSVGINDPHNRQNTQAIEKLFYPEVGRRIGLYHVQGAFNYTTMDKWDKWRMKRKYRRAKEKPPEKRSLSDNNLLNNFGHPVDFCNKESLASLLNGIRNKV